VHTIAILWFAVRLMTGKIFGRFIETIPIEFANFKANLLRKFSLSLSLSLSLCLSASFLQRRECERAEVCQILRKMRASARDNERLT